MSDIVCAQPSNQTLPPAVVGQNYIIVAQAATTVSPPAGTTINNLVRMIFLSLSISSHHHNQIFA
jgi:hypothetical protein